MERRGCPYSPEEQMIMASNSSTSSSAVRKNKDFFLFVSEFNFFFQDTCKNEERGAENKVV